MDREETEPVRLQRENDQLLAQSLKDIHAALEKLFAKTYQSDQITTASGLRQLRTRITSLKSGSSNLIARKGERLEEFYKAEHELADSCIELTDWTKRALVDIKNIDMLEVDDLITKLEANIDRRCDPDNGILQEYRSKIIRKKADEAAAARDHEIDSGGTAVEENRIIDLKEEPVSQPSEESEMQQATSEIKMDTTEQEQIKKEEIDTQTLSTLYSYINTLEQKYSSYQPEISDKGDYISNADWKVELGNRSIKGTVKEGMFRTLLIINTRWHPSTDLRDLMEYIQRHAKTLPSGQYESLCLINTSWDLQIREWVKNYNHQRLGLFLYDLEDGSLTYNRNYDKNRLFVFWHDTNPEKQNLQNRIVEWLETEDTLTSSDLISSFDLNKRGAEKLIKELEKSEVLLNVGFDSPGYMLLKKENNKTR